MQDSTAFLPSGTASSRRRFPDLLETSAVRAIGRVGRFVAGFLAPFRFCRGIVFPSAACVGAGVAARKERKRNPGNERQEANSGSVGEIRTAAYAEERANPGSSVTCPGSALRMWLHQSEVGDGVCAAESRIQTSRGSKLVRLEVFLSPPCRPPPSSFGTPEVSLLECPR